MLWYTNFNGSTRAHGGDAHTRTHAHARTHTHTHTHTHTMKRASYSCCNFLCIVLAAAYLKYRLCRLSCLPFVWHPFFHCDTHTHIRLHTQKNHICLISQLSRVDNFMKISWWPLFSGSLDWCGRVLPVRHQRSGRVKWKYFPTKEKKREYLGDVLYLQGIQGKSNFCWKLGGSFYSRNVLKLEEWINGAKFDVRIDGSWPKPNSSVHWDGSSSGWFWSVITPFAHPNLCLPSTVKALLVDICLGVQQNTDCSILERERQKEKGVGEGDKFIRWQAVIRAETNPLILANPVLSVNWNEYWVPSNTTTTPNIVLKSHWRLNVIVTEAHHLWD